MDFFPVIPGLFRQAGGGDSWSPLIFSSRGGGRSKRRKEATERRARPGSQPAPAGSRRSAIEEPQKSGAKPRQKARPPLGDLLCSDIRSPPPPPPRCPCSAPPLRSTETSVSKAWSFCGWGFPFSLGILHLYMDEE